MQDVAVIADPVLDEKIHRRVFSSGLTAYVVRKKGFSKSYATIATRYGSIDTALPKPARNEGLPDGVAHFLEHKVFSTPDGDTFDRFAAQGASANAFTTFSSTSYLFGTSTNYTANLRTLLEMVFSLYVTDDNVEKEKGIIGQEIAMYDDDPDWRIYFGALQALYHKHPVAIDIAGTSKTISGITPELLQRIHRAYYHPRIMAFAAVSPEPVERTFREIERAVEGRSYGRAPGRRRVDVDEPASVRKASVRLKLPVARPRLIAAFKDTPAGYGRRRLKRELAAAVAIDCLFGSAGTVFLGLYEDSLVDEHFSCSYTGDETYSFAMIGGETDDVRRLQRELGRRLEEARAAGVSRDDFERVRNKEIGSYARAFNAPERIAQMLVSHHLRGTTLTDYRELL
ncbi:MAG: insulinase family protein, partial [Planctomycetota bacterium]|nr:insulinase family protein [Planctomycetota bacterium]